MIDDLLNDPDINEPDESPIEQAEEVSNEDYVFADGELPPSDQLDAFLEEFAINKEEKGAPDEPTPEELEEDELPEDEDAISTQTARNTATFIVSIVDEGASAGLAYLSKDDQNNFRAGKEQKKNLENLFTKFCKEKDTEIPITWQIFFCLATVYGAKIPYAIDRRNLNEQLALIKREREALENDRKRIDEERVQMNAEWKAIRSMRNKQNSNGGKPTTIPTD